MIESIVAAATPVFSNFFLDFLELLMAIVKFFSS